MEIGFILNVLAQLILARDKLRNHILVQAFARANPNIRIDDTAILEEMPLVLALTRTASLEIGRRTVVRTHVAFKLQGALHIGSNCYIGPFSFFNVRSGITIGDNVLIGEAVSFVDHDHQFRAIGLNISDQGFEEEPIIIEDNVWIGAGARILRGVRIQHSSVIGAGSVVAENIPPMSLAAGVPARIICTLDSFSNMSAIESVAC